MNDRFKFNVVVSSYYDIDTPEHYEEFEPTFYLKNVDVFYTGEIGIDYDVLLDAVKKQSKNLTEKEIGQIMQHFEDNSNSLECDFVTIKPDKILQCTGLKDKNGKLIFEGDVVKFKDNITINGSKTHIAVVEHNEAFNAFMYHAECMGLYSVNKVQNEQFDVEVIGNIYENPELLKECE